MALSHIHRGYLHSFRAASAGTSGLPKVILFAIAEVEGEGGKTSALKVEAEGEAKGLVFCI